MRDPRDLRTLADDEPTGEEEIPDFDPTSTDQLGASNLMGSTGIIERDDQGNARWVVYAPSRPAERTFDLLKALDNDALEVQGGKPAPDSKPNPKTGYNPYDTGPAKPPTKCR